MAQTRIRYLTHDGNGQHVVVAEVPDPPLDQEGRVAAYENEGSPDDRAMTAWAQEHLWPVVKDGPKCRPSSKKIDLLLTFLADDPAGEYEQEFFFNKRGQVI